MGRDGRGHIVHNWKARWFILRQNTLLYYKFEGGRKVTPPKGRILLDGCTITCPCLEYENRPVSEGPSSQRLPPTPQTTPFPGLLAKGGMSHGKSRVTEKPRLKSWLHHIPGTWPWAGNWTSLSLSSSSINLDNVMTPDCCSQLWWRSWR